MQKKERYTIKEISMATGIKRGTLDSRRRKDGIPTNPEGYTLAEAKRMMQKRISGKRASQKKADRLKARLMTDGYM